VTRPLALGIVADVRAALAGLVRLLDARAAKRRDGGDVARYRKASDDWWAAQRAKFTAKSGGIHPAQVMQAVGRAFGREAIYVADGGMTSLWAHWCLPATRPRSYHNILELGMLGTGIPSAIGSKLAEPERDVVCVTGDGAAGFNFMEMQSAARERLPLVAVVLAEGSWTMEEPNERMRWGRTFGTEMGTVRWDEVARGLGCHGEYVEKAEEIAPALERARKAGGPAAVCVRTDRDANMAVPPELLLRFTEVYSGPTR
jgi:acetolactate synthase-1/2/3 large subunit